MNPDTLKKAQAGDVEAMLELMQAAIDENDLNTAIDWADKAAEHNNYKGMYGAALLHTDRMRLLVDTPFTGLLSEDCKGAKENSVVLIGCHQKGLIALEPETLSQLQDILQDALYYEALIECMKENSNSEHVYHLLESISDPRECAVCGVALFEMKRYTEAKRRLLVASGDSYMRTKKGVREEGAYSLAMTILASLERAESHWDKAVQILRTTMEYTSDDDVKKTLMEELSRYQKKLFGGWRYV